MSEKCLFCNHFTYDDLEDYFFCVYEDDIHLSFDLKSLEDKCPL